MDEARQRPAFQRNGSNHDNVERGNSLPAYNESNDPYDLRSGLKTPEEIVQTVTANSSRKRNTTTCVGVPLGNPKEVIRTHRLQGFYKAQNENIERLLKPVDEHVRLAKEEQGADALQYKIAVTGSFAANILLAVLQVSNSILRLNVVGSERCDTLDVSAVSPLLLRLRSDLRRHHRTQLVPLHHHGRCDI